MNIGTYGGPGRRQWHVYSLPSSMWDYCASNSLLQNPSLCTPPSDLYGFYTDLSLQVYPTSLPVKAAFVSALRLPTIYSPVQLLRITHSLHHHRTPFERTNIAKSPHSLDFYHPLCPPLSPATTPATPSPSSSSYSLSSSAHSVSSSAVTPSTAPSVSIQMTTASSP